MSTTSRTQTTAEWVWTIVEQAEDMQSRATERRDLINLIFAVCGTETEKAIPMDKTHSPENLSFSS